MKTIAETKIIVLTQAQFDARKLAGTLEAGVEYKIIGDTMPDVPTTNDGEFALQATVTGGASSLLWNQINKKVVDDTGLTSIALDDNVDYYLTNIQTLAITYPTESFHTWLRISLVSSGTITIAFPTSRYIGATPVFAPGETWELDIKDGIVAAAKVE